MHLMKRGLTLAMLMDSITPKTYVHMVSKREKSSTTSGSLASFGKNSNGKEQQWIAVEKDTVGKQNELIHETTIVISRTCVCICVCVSNTV